MADYINVKMDKESALNMLLERVRYWTEDEDFEKVLKLYKEQGLGDVSCEDFDCYKISFIEAVDNEENPKMFLVRL